MVDKVIRGGYAVPYSLPSIKKLDKKITAVQKKIFWLPNCTRNVITQLPHDMSSIEAISSKNAYLKNIGEQLRNALNDTRKLGIIYKSLTNFTLAKYGGAKEIPKTKQHNCLISLSTRILYLIKRYKGAHLRSTIRNLKPDLLNKCG